MPEGARIAQITVDRLRVGDTLSCPFDHVYERVESITRTGRRGMRAIRTERHEHVRHFSDTVEIRCGADRWTY